MPKFFTTQVGGVQGLARDDPMAPIRETERTGQNVVRGIQLAGAVAKTLDVYQTKQATEEYTEWFGKAAEMAQQAEDFVTNNRVMPTSEVPGAPVPEEATVTSGGVEMVQKPEVNMFEVGESLYETRRADIVEMVNTNVSNTRARDKILQDLELKYFLPGGEAVRDTLSGQRDEYYKGLAMVEFQNLVNQGNLKGAFGVVGRNAQYFTGPEQAQLKIEAVSGTTRANATRELVEATTIADVERIRETMIYSGNMTPADQQVMEARAQTQIGKLESDYDEAKGDTSANRRNYAIAALTTGQQPMDINQVMEAVRGMEPEDALAVINANRAARTGAAAASDPVALSHLARSANDIFHATTQEEQTKRKRLYMLQVSNAAANGAISPDDMFKFMARGSDIQQMVTDSPEDKRMMDDIHVTLTGASRGNVTMGATSAANISNAIDAENAFIDWRLANPGVDPNVWRKSFMPDYVTKAGRAAKDRAQTSRDKGYIMRGKDGRIDYDESVSGIQRALKNDVMDRDRAERVMDLLEEQRRIEALSIEEKQTP